MHTNEDAFTLVELLIVIAIIAILATLILPALNNARDTAKTISCSSQQKQVMFAMLAYSDENKNMIPPGNMDAWVTSWSDCLVKNRNIPEQRKNTRSVLVCPSGPEKGIYKNHHYSYGVHIWGNDWKNPDGFIYQDPNHASVRYLWFLPKIKSPSATIIIADSGNSKTEVTNSTSVFYLEIGNGVGTNVALLNHHGGRSLNAAFPDGHAANIYQAALFAEFGAVIDSVGFNR